MPSLSEESMAERRDALMRAALKCFARNGFRATSMRDICKEAGVSVGGLYCHFKSKEEMILAIAEQPEKDQSDIFAEATKAVAEGTPATEAACKTLGMLISFVHGPEGRERLNGDVAIMGEAVTMPAMREILVATDRRHVSNFAKLLAADVSNDDAQILAQLFVTLLSGMIVMSAFHDDYDCQALIGQLQSLLSCRFIEAQISS